MNKILPSGKPNILITGGAGFIGSHLADFLVKKNNVIVVDNFVTGSEENINHLLQNPNFEFIKHDLTKPLDFKKYEELDKFKIKFQGIQEIYHLACPTSPKNFEELKLHSLWANSAGMLSTLDLAVKHKAKYVFTSSSVIYGPPQTEYKVFNEVYEGKVNHLSPRGSYDEGKRFAETCVETYRQVYGLDAKIARIFSTYGSRMKLRDGLLVPDFIINALENKDLIIYGDEYLEQSLCYVSDIIDGLIRLMKAEPELSLVNLGGDEIYSMKEVAQKIINMSNSQSQVKFEDPLKFLTPKGMPDLTTAKEELGWLPLIVLEDGLKKMIDYTIANKEMLNLTN